MANIPEDLQAKLTIALHDGDAEEADALAREILETGIDPLLLIQAVLVPTLNEIGQKFQDFQIFLPELVMAGEAAQAVSTLVEEATLKTGKASTIVGTVVLGQVEGDVHDIGRNIFGTLLKSHGFKVIDLGRNVRPSAFLDAAEKEQADIVGLSALMTTTMPAQKRTINLFAEVGVRDRYKLIIGGGPCSQEWTDEIKADGYAPDAASGVALCKSLIDGKQL